MKYQGRIEHWDDAKGFGFVEPNGGGIRAFAHIKAFNHRSRRPVNGDIIVYEIEKDKQNSYRAHNISLLSDYKTKRSRSAKQASQNKLTTVLFTVLLITLVAFLTVGGFPTEVLYGYISLSVFTFALYGVDKSSARKNRWRIAESKLHFLGFVGGWPGAFAAQRVFKHKRSKAEFMRVYWATAVLHLFVLGLISFDVIDISRFISAL